MKPTLGIGLLGYAGAGKTTLAKALSKELGYTRASLKGPLVEAARALFPPLTKLDHTDQTVKDTGLPPDNPFSTVRGLFEGLGAIVERHLGTDWLMQEWLRRYGTPDHCVFDDIRTEGQVKAFTKAGGVLYWLGPQHSTSTLASDGNLARIRAAKNYNYHLIPGDGWDTPKSVEFIKDKLLAEQLQRKWRAV